MTIAYFSNFLNHHQKLVADEMYEMTKHQYVFVETTPMYDWLKKGGYTDYSQEPYVLRAWENEENRQKALDLAKSSDVALFGGPEVLAFEVFRARNTNKLSFEVSERWLKRGLLNILSPRLIKNKWYYHTLFLRKPFYKLCASAFCALDEYKLHSYKDRCYKWGYFTLIEDIEPNSKEEFNSEKVRMMWCSRFLKWKHPELPVLLAKRLKDKGFDFHLDMYGSGEMYDKTYSLVNEYKLSEVVTLCGNLPNAEILQSMREHDIFLFTSDQNEGWGAVANEAMSNGCVLVGSDAIGSTPYLIKDGVNGILFKSSVPKNGFTKSGMKVDEKALDSLTEKVEWLLNHPNERIQMSKNAYLSMKNVWSPENAAKNFMQLVDDLMQGKDSSIYEGPCSKALPIE